jgi:dolichol-phosphate mannosyltransferase
MPKDVSAFFVDCLFNSTIPRPLGRGLPLKEEELEKPGGFSNSGFHIDTPPLEAGRFIMGERNRFIPGMQGWVGFETTTIYYERQDRKAGKAKQTLGRLSRYALNAIFSFSYKPLRLNFIVGFATMIFFFIYGVVLLVRRILNIDVVSVFTTPTVAIFFLGGLLLISNGIMGEYVARIYDEVKKRPLYIISRKFSRRPDGDLIAEDIKEV